MTPLHQILKINYFLYDNLRHRYFLRWCEKLSEKHFLPLQTLTRHDALLNFYQDEWHTMVEKRFFRELDDYLKAEVVTPQEAINFIDIYAEDINDISPTPLLKMIQKELKNNSKKMIAQ